MLATAARRYSQATEPITRYNIAGYARISVDVEADRDSTSIENQRAIITDYVEKHFPGSRFTFYADRDRSGYTFGQRESYQEMRPLLMNGTYDILIVKDFSRFSRRNSRGLVELEDLRDAGLRIIAIGDSIDYPTYDDWTNIRLRFLLNEMPVTDSSQKVKAVIDRRQKDGKWICSVPYGYIITNTKNMTYEVDETAAAVVRLVYEKYLEGWGYAKIAKHLTASGIPTPRTAEKARKEADGTVTHIRAKNVWSIVSVQGILQNDFYTGVLRQRKYHRRGINGKDFQTAENEHIVFEDAHEAIIDKETFARVQKLMAHRTKSHYRGISKYNNAYSGLIFCGDCGAPMFAMSRKDLARAYTCGTYQRRTLAGCTAHHTRMDLLDEILRQHLRIVRENGKSIIEQLEEQIKKPDKDKRDTADTIASLERSIHATKEHIKLLTKQKLTELSRRPEQEELLNETYDALLEEDMEKLSTLQNQLTLLQERQHNQPQIEEAAKKAIEILSEIISKPEFDREDVYCLVERITVYADHIDIQLKSDIDVLIRASTLETIETAESFSIMAYEPPKHSPVPPKTVNVVSGGDPLEIYTDRDGEVILKKYSPIGEMSAFAKDYTESIFRAMGHIACIVDRDQVVAASGVNKKELWDKPISHDLEQVIASRQTQTYSRMAGGKMMSVTNEEDNTGYTAQVVSPIIADGEAIGAVLLLSREQGARMGDIEVKVAETAAGIVGRQMEQ